MTDAESAEEMQHESLPVTNTIEHIKWYVEHRLVPVVVFLLLSIVFIAAAPPWGEFSQMWFYGMLNMAAGALVFEAVKYQPWRGS